MGPRPRRHHPVRAAGPSTTDLTRYLPRQVSTDPAGFEALAGLHGATRRLFGELLTLDLTHLRFFDANMCAPLGAVLALVADRFNAVRVVNIVAPVEQIFRKNRFLVRYGYPSLPDTNHTTMPFRRLRLPGDGEFSEYVSDQFRGKGLPRMSDRAADAFRKSVFEVFQNATLHSDSELGAFACGQFFPNKERLDFTMADAGIGIRDRVRHYLGVPDLSSVSCLCWAIQPRHSTRAEPSPGGLGFEFLKKFANLNGGRIQIVSRRGYYEFRGTEDVFRPLDADYPGTAVTIEINTADSGRYVTTNEIPSSE